MSCCSQRLNSGFWPHRQMIAASARKLQNPAYAPSPHFIQYEAWFEWCRMRLNHFVLQYSIPFAEYRFFTHNKLFFSVWNSQISHNNSWYELKNLTWGKPLQFRRLWRSRCSGQSCFSWFIDCLHVLSWNYFWTRYCISFLHILQYSTNSLFQK